MDEDGDEGMEDEEDEDMLDDEADIEDCEVEEEKAPIKPLKPVKTPDRDVVPANLDNPEIEKALRSVLNKVSEGNIEVMFTSLMDLVKKFVGKGTGKPSMKVAIFAHCYAKIFIQMNISSQQQMNAILSVNCALVCGIQRLLGDAYFSLVARALFKALMDLHPVATGVHASEINDKD